jgi:protein-tyrosine phosphatase
MSVIAARAAEGASGVLHVLFVCTGNICRSPMSERLALAYAATTGIPDFQASSAGTRAVIGSAMHPEAAAVVARYGADETNFVARRLAPKLIRDADLVLTMTKSHRNAVVELLPQALHRTFTLSEAAQLAISGNAASVSELSLLRPHLNTKALFDIADPIGQDARFFTAVGAQISELLPRVIDLCRQT